MNVFNFSIPTKEETTKKVVDIITANAGDFNIDNSSVLSNIANCFIQLITENNENWLKVASNLNLQTAEGVWLDILANNIGFVRNIGSYTQQEINIVCDKSLTLYGKDNTEKSTFTIADNKNKRYLLKTTTSLVAGVNTLLFESEDIDAISSVIGTITNIITNVVGVKSVNNLSEPLSIGSIYESDFKFRNRVIKGRQILSTGTEEGLYSQLSSLTGVVDVVIFNNDSNEYENEIPPRTLYVIILGGATNDILNVFARNLITTPTFGSISGVVKTIQGQYKTYYWDIPQTIDLEINTTIKSFQGNITSYESEIKIAMQDITDFKINQVVDSAIIDEFLIKVLKNKSINAFPYDTTLRIKNTGSYAKYVIPSLKKHKFGLVSANIHINFV